MAGQLGHTIDGQDIFPLLYSEPGAGKPHEAFYFYYQANELQAVRGGSGS